MKIDGIKPAGDGGEISKKKTEKTSEKSFDSFLKESVSALPRKDVTNASAPASAMRKVAVEPTGKAINAKAITQVEAVLDDLDFYRNVLGSSDVPLSRLVPMAETLAEKKDALVAILPHVEEPEVRDLITRTAALVVDENSRLHSSLY